MPTRLSNCLSGFQLSHQRGDSGIELVRDGPGLGARIRKPPAGVIVTSKNRLTPSSQCLYVQ